MNDGNVRQHLSIALLYLYALAGAGPAASQPSEPLELALVSLDGEAQLLGAVPPTVFAPRLSPDGREVVFETIETSADGRVVGASLWVQGLADPETRRRLAPVAGPMNWAALWTPDGRELVFLVSGERPDAIYRRAADGTGSELHLVDGRSAESWTASGSQMTYLTLRGDGDYGISLLDLASGTGRTLIDLPGSAEHSSSISPDGGWFAFATNETGRYEVWVAPLDDPQSRHRITDSGGGHPLWSPDGSFIYFDRDRRLFEVAVERRIDGTVAAGEAKALPIEGFLQGEYRRQFDLTPDGRRVLIVRPAQ
jgi:eukaryotic-like serine/threonine-protein kinase